MKERKELRVTIRFHRGEEINKEFDCCEEAWAWEREIKNYHLKRRAKKDRKYIEISTYVGCTVYGQAYGGILTQGYLTKESAEWTLKTEKEMWHSYHRRHFPFQEKPVFCFEPEMV